MSRRVLRGLLIATPFALLAVGFWALVASPWPRIWRLMLNGNRVVVAYTWSTLVLLVLATACFAGALAISFNIKRERS